MECPRCGQQAEPSDVLCSSCGQKLSTGGSAKVVWRSGPIRIRTRTVTHVFCGGCGQEVPLGEKSCPKCGHPMPSREEIEQKLRLARDRAASDIAETPGRETMKCAHCGQPLELVDGRCKACGNPAELPGMVREALQEIIGGAPARAAAPVRLQTGSRISPSVLAILFLLGGLGALFGPKPRFELHHPLSPHHIVGLVLLGVAAILVIADKFTGNV